MDCFDVPVGNLREARLLLKTLADYDRFQFENRVKPDYCNAGGLMVFDERLWSESGSLGDWTDWSASDGRDFDEIPDAELDSVRWQIQEGE